MSGALGAVVANIVSSGGGLPSDLVPTGVAGSVNGSVGELFEAFEGQRRNSVTPRCALKAGVSSRPLSATEDRLLRYLLSNMGGHAATLLPHLDGAQVIDEDDPAQWLQIQVRSDVRPVDLPDAPIPGSAVVEGPNGEIRGELFVWTLDGRLDALHQAPYVDEAPTSMPDPAAVRVYPAPRWT